MDRGLRLRTPHRGSARPHHPSCPHPGNERRQLPAQAKPPQKKSTHHRPLSPPPNAASGGEEPLPLRSRAPSPPKTTPSSSLLLLLVAPFCSAQVVYFYSALDTIAAKAAQAHP